MASVVWSLNESPCDQYVDANLLIETSTDGINFTTEVNPPSNSNGSFTVGSGVISIRVTTYATSSWPTSNCKLVCQFTDDLSYYWGLVSYHYSDSRQALLGVPTNTLYISAFSLYKP